MVPFRSFFIHSSAENRLLMVSILKFRSIYGALRCFHSGSKSGFSALDRDLKLVPNPNRNRVGLFWDLDNKPPNSIPPYEVANKLRVAASKFGVVGHMVAYANSHTFSHVPLLVGQRRKEKELLNRLERKGIIKKNEPHLCRVCGRKFYTNEKLVNHFRQLHEREHAKRMNQIESARGSMRVKLVVKYSMKEEKYKKAARDILTPKVGFGLADELQRAGFWVQTVLDKPQVADRALESHIVDMMDHRQVECVVLVSDDSDFVNVIQEAKLRCLKTVVMGDTADGVLKRVADAAFSWEEILLGKAKKEAVSVVENWKDRDILKRLEWTYNPEVHKKTFDLDDSVTEASEDENIEEICDEVDDDYKDDKGAWWELNSDEDVTNEQTGSKSVRISGVESGGNNERFRSRHHMQQLCSCQRTRTQQGFNTEATLQQRDAQTKAVNASSVAAESWRRTKTYSLCLRCSLVKTLSGTHPWKSLQTQGSKTNLLFGFLVKFQNRKQIPILYFLGNELINKKTYGFKEKFLSKLNSEKYIIFTHLFIEN